MFKKCHSRASTSDELGANTDGGDELALYHQALAQSGDAVLIANFDGLITYVNTAFERITGFTATEVIGRRPSILKSGEHDESFYRKVWTALKQGRSFRGVFINRNKNGLLFHEEKTISPISNRAGEITHYVSTGRNVNARIATERQLQRLAYIDELTGLPNRKQFLRRLEEYAESETVSGVGVLLLLNIRNLKNINDTLGRRAGDQALREIARRLKSLGQRSYCVARVGGSEFTILVKDRCDCHSIHILAQGILGLLGEPINLGGQEAFLSANIGIAWYPNDANSPEDLLCHADIALHQAKQAGRNMFLSYQDSMRDNLRADLQIESALHGALERNEFYLVFQPVVHSATCAVVSVEALLRWASPSHETISPTRFIPLLERNGLIIQVGRWVLETACIELTKLHSNGMVPLRVAVNISARQLEDLGFAAHVRHVLEKTGLAPEQLELEITESVLIEDDSAEAVLRDLRQLGIRIAADDFGTGYSSLSYLWKFPFTTIKIDRSFVVAMDTDPQVVIIVNSILTLASSLSLDVVAEGIETETQFEALKTLGCRFIQGYWTGRPSSIAELDMQSLAPNRQNSAGLEGQ